jgi:PAS domain-containing protein
MMYVGFEMAHLKPDSPLQDETALRWSRLEDEREACVVVSDRMDLVYINMAARELVPGEWFGRRCFEVLPIVDEACAFHCPKIRAVNESVDIVYCEETVFVGKAPRVFGVGLIPLGRSSGNHARAVLLLRAKEESVDESAFRAQLLKDAKSLARRIAAG